MTTIWKAPSGQLWEEVKRSDTHILLSPEYACRIHSGKQHRLVGNYIKGSKREVLRLSLEDFNRLNWERVEPNPPAV